LQQKSSLTSRQLKGEARRMIAPENAEDQLEQKNWPFR
jgi:hypothetical protein